MDWNIAYVADADAASGLLIYIYGGGGILESPCFVWYLWQIQAEGRWKENKTTS